MGVRTGAHRTISGLLMGTPFDVSGNIENQASRRSMGIQLAVGAHDAAFRGGYLSPCMDHLALGAYRWHAVVERGAPCSPSVRAW
ncbi:hypothetical protein GCM10027288_36560 [Bordetella tumbae]